MHGLADCLFAEIVEQLDPAFGRHRIGGYVYSQVVGAVPDRGVDGSEQAHAIHIQLSQAIGERLGRLEGTVGHDNVDSTTLSRSEHTISLHLTSFVLEPDGHPFERPIAKSVGLTEKPARVLFGRELASPCIVIAPDCSVQPIGIVEVQVPGPPNAQLRQVVRASGFRARSD